MVGAFIVTVVVLIFTTILLVIATKVFSRSRSRDSIGGGGGGGDVPITQGTSSIITTTSSSSSSSRSRKYHLFLSFRGEDTRKTFVDHLYYALQQHGIITYKDDVTLDRGDTIGPSLLNAIHESQIALIILSDNYADSSWCLDELSYIMKCKEERGQIVMPIFYNIDPSDVRNQKNQFGKAFAKAKHKVSKNINKIESWKKALVDVSSIAGWETNQVANGFEAKCIQEIVGSILDKLLILGPAVEDEDLVGMRSRMEQLKSQLRIGSGGVRMVGIWGIGGGGKTTLATSVFMELKTSGQFHHCCFVGNIREESEQKNGLKSLQEKILLAVFERKIEVESVDIGKSTIKRMLCHTNVLIVLDDVDNLEQLEALAGRHHWFGNGSRIIVTTRNEQVLISHRVDEVFPVSLLSDDEAIQLFKRHAYQNNSPVEDYEKLSLRVISYVNGLPLALKILGSFLYGKDKKEWLSTLARLKDHPEMDILEKLKISYDGLKDVEKELFLDIACFHRGMNKDEAMVMLNACGFYPDIGVKVLIQKALISVSEDGTFDMHDLVQEMGHYIVRREDPNNPEKHSRLWRKEDIEDICSRNEIAENNKIEAISVSDRCSSDFIMLVSNMKKLRFLKMRTLLTNFDGQPSGILSNELRYINWRGYPESPFAESFQPRKLGYFKIENSLQKELWKGDKYLPSLKQLELSNMEELVRTPDFGGLPCLEKLILRYCPSLKEIHKSLGNHSSLVSVQVIDCNKLTRFPSIVGLYNLKILKISCCLKLTEFPKIEAKMDNLVELKLYLVGIEVLPSSVGEYCTNLISFNLEACENLKRIEGNFHALKCIENFQVNLSVYPGSNIGNGFLCQLPRSIRKLDLKDCKFKDGDIPNEIGELFNLQELHLCWNEFTRLDFSLSRLTHLKLLYLNDCHNLVELPELPSSLAILRADDCESLEAVIRYEIYRNCKWLCNVSITGWRSVKGAERLLETMLLQGNGSWCMSLELEGLEIARGFEPGLIEGRTCGMQLPGNWFNDFSGFLICAIFDEWDENIEISMKHAKDNKYDGWMEIGDSRHDNVYWEDMVDDNWKRYYSWVGYIPFSLLIRTSWWDPTSTAIHMKMDYGYEYCRGWGFKVVPKTSAETTPPTHSSSSSSSFEISLDDDHYKCDFRILADSKSAFKCSFPRH